MLLQTDTIIYDTKKIAEYQADGRFDYNAQLPAEEYPTWTEWLTRWFNRLMNKMFSGNFEEQYTTPIMIILFVVIILAVLFFLYKSRPELFSRTKKTEPIPYDVEEENIHEIDFEQDISSALNAGNYRLATRLKYLQTLRCLSDSNSILWQIHKTPTEYLYEIRNKEIKQSFRELTQHFLRIRYGNYNATATLFDTVDELHRKITSINERDTN